MKDSSKLKDGKFGAMMQVSIINDGPVTIILDSNSPDPMIKELTIDKGEDMKKEIDDESHK